ncbi:MAG: hypothetical protein MZV65_52640 [Chromatiales bacterium]|nr:hypothetical protein [Chromatiales bacterium]
MKKFVLRHYQRLKTHPNHWVRKTAGVLLIVGGMLGFLPVLGYWMLPPRTGVAGGGLAGGAARLPQAGERVGSTGAGTSPQGPERGPAPKSRRYSW